VVIADQADDIAALFVGQRRAAICPIDKLADVGKHG